MVPNRSVVQEASLGRVVGQRVRKLGEVAAMHQCLLYIQPEACDEVIMLHDEPTKLLPRPKITECTYGRHTPRAVLAAELSGWEGFIECDENLGRGAVAWRGSEGSARQIGRHSIALRPHSRSSENAHPGHLAKWCRV
jgi:hypothetical protein